MTVLTATYVACKLLSSRDAMFQIKSAQCKERVLSVGSSVVLVARHVFSLPCWQKTVLGLGVLKHFSSVPWHCESERSCVFAPECWYSHMLIMKQLGCFSGHCHSLTLNWVVAGCFCDSCGQGLSKQNQQAVVEFCVSWIPNPSKSKHWLARSCAVKTLLAVPCMIVLELLTYYSELPYISGALYCWTQAELLWIHFKLFITRR